MGRVTSPTDKRLQQPAHMRYRQQLLSLGADLRPAGSVNREVLAATRGNHAKGLLEQDTRLRGVIERYCRTKDTCTLENAYRALYGDSEGVPDCATVAANIYAGLTALVCPVIRDHRLVPVFTISQIRLNGSGTKPRQLVTVVTPEGEAALSPDTILVLDRERFAAIQEHCMTPMLPVDPGRAWPAAVAGPSLLRPVVHLGRDSVSAVASTTISGPSLLPRDIQSGK